MYLEAEVKKEPARRRLVVDLWFRGSAGPWRGAQATQELGGLAHESAHVAVDANETSLR
jgi:hypothetical protein